MRVTVEKRQDTQMMTTMSMGDDDCDHGEDEEEGRHEGAK